MIDLIYDCDLTMGLPDRDVDDGLALMALLGDPELRLLGVTSTFGNGTLEEVHPCLEKTLSILGAEDVPCRRGAASVQDRSSPAARFLAESAAVLAGRGRGLRILATGALTNLYGAALHDPAFFRNLAEIVVMGGVTEPLRIGGRVMGELNFACDPEAACRVLRSGAPVTVISGNLCLRGFLSRERLLEGLEEIPPSLRGLLWASLEPWLDWYRREYRLEGFHPWDAIAALFLTAPELFASRRRIVTSTVEDLRAGFVRTETAGKPDAATTPVPPGAASHRPPRAPMDRPAAINLPQRLLDPEEVHARLFAAWKRLGVTLEGLRDGGPGRRPTRRPRRLPGPTAAPGSEGRR